MLPFWKKRPTPASSPPVRPAEAADLLALEEEQAFAASVLKKRSELASVPAPAPLHPREISEEMEWTEQGDVYRPTAANAPALLNSFGLSESSPLRAGKSLCFVRRTAWETLQAHLRKDTRIELGGLLVGQAFYDAERTVYIVVVEQALPALDGAGTALTFSYTEETWRTLSPQMQNLPPDWTLLGSYHSHPGLGVFLSSTDLETQRGVFFHDWQVALVVDPLSNAIGFFFGAEGHPCPHWQLL